MIEIEQFRDNLEKHFWTSQVAFTNTMSILRIEVIRELFFRRLDDTGILKAHRFADPGT